MNNIHKPADVCLVLEGTYPYVSGGVSSWTHQLLNAHSDLTFHLISILPPGADTEMKYSPPDNVISLTNVYLQDLPKASSSLSFGASKSLFTSLEVPLLTLQSSHARLKDLEKVIKVLSDCPKPLGKEILMDSEEAWNMLLRMYNATMGDHAFLDYFWSWRALLGGLYSLLLTEIPNASCYHSLCTGYAGVFLARAGVETGKPCLLTEHGIYTNERRIEIASADWLDDQSAQNFNIERHRVLDRTLRDFWMDSFIGYSRICYKSCDAIVTLFEGNKAFQIADGAEEDKLHVISNGIDYKRFSSIEHGTDHPPTIALIGRVVPIKDIKTFIRSCGIIKESIPDLCAYIIGPTDEDEAYYDECVEMVELLHLQDTVTFTGKVVIDEYLARIDVMVLTSISEAQPLVILEAGAAGIPTVATDVGGCKEMILGRSDEQPQLGAGGGVASLSNSQSVAREIRQLLEDKEYYTQCSQTIKQRVYNHYREEDQHESYGKLYESLINQKKDIKKVS